MPFMKISLKLKHFVFGCKLNDAREIVLYFGGVDDYHLVCGSGTEANPKTPIVAVRPRIVHENTAHGQNSFPWLRLNEGCPSSSLAHGRTHAPLLRLNDEPFLRKANRLFVIRSIRRENGNRAPHTQATSSVFFSPPPPPLSLALVQRRALVCVCPKRA